jgi:folate-binding protein YgfZ
LHEFHAHLNATFAAVNGAEVVAHYGNAPAEHAALRDAAGVIDLSGRSRLCLTGADRVTFLHGQVTNDVKRLKPGEGCYAALISAKGRMQSDLNLYVLADEVLLDFEPGYASAVAQRLEKYVIAADVQVVDAAPHYGLLSVQGPRAMEVVAALNLGAPLPGKPFHFITVQEPTLGQVYLVNQPRLGTAGYDLFVPVGSLGAVADKLITAVRAVGGRACGWDALETVRIEAAIPRFGQDMDESNLPPEAGLDERAISYSKGCYIGQEIIARIRTYGQVAKTLRGLKLADGLKSLPKKGDKLHRGDQEIGYVTSAIASPTLKSNIALAYLRREANAPGTELTLRTEAGDSPAVVVTVPFQPFTAG